MQAATAQIDSVEFHRVGQTNRLGRYPVHFHLLGHAGSRSYVRGCSIHRSYYRCVSLHGTHGATVSANVAYDAIGHCYYLEDGVEESNTLARSLGRH